MCRDRFIFLLRCKFNLKINTTLASDEFRFMNYVQSVICALVVILVTSVRV